MNRLTQLSILVCVLYIQFADRFFVKPVTGVWVVAIQKVFHSSLANMINLVKTQLYSITSQSKRWKSHGFPVLLHDILKQTFQISVSEETLRFPLYRSLFVYFMALRRYCYTEWIRAIDDR